MQICPLNACKLDWEENLFDFYVESLAFRIKILINVTSMYCDGVVLEIYLDYTFQWPQEGLNCEPLAYEAVTTSYARDSQFKPSTVYHILQALSGDFQHGSDKMYALITLGVRWCAMCVFVFQKFYSFIKGTVRI